VAIDFSEFIRSATPCSIHETSCQTPRKWLAGYHIDVDVFSKISAQIEDPVDDVF
jgi:hypothetical protein